MANEVDSRHGQQTLEAGLAGVTAALLESLTAADVAQVIVGRGVTALGADAGLVALVSADCTAIEVVAARGYGASTRGWDRFRLGDRLPVTDAVREDRPLFLTDRRAWADRYPDLEHQVSDSRFGASATVPLVVRGQPFGALHFSFRTGHAFDEADRALVLELASRCALALERARLYDDAHNAVEALRASEATLRESEERLRLALAAAGQRTWELDLTTGRGWLSERFAVSQSSLPASTANGDADRPAVPDPPLDFTFEESFALLHPEDADRVRATFDAAVRGETPSYEATFRIALDGTALWVMSVGTVLRDADGTPHRAIGVIRDVTREREMAAERERMAADQRRFLREMLFGLTEGRMRLCETEADLPKPLAPMAEKLLLDRMTIRVLRKRAEAAAEEAGFATERTRDLETAVGEAAMNAVNHAGGGIGRVHTDRERGVVQVWVRDTGTGIAADQIHRALEPGWTTAGTFGHGFWIMLKMVDRIYLLTGAEGTTVVLEQDRERPRPFWV